MMTAERRTPKPSRPCPRIAASIRPLAKADTKHVIGIEQLCFSDDPWDEGLLLLFCNEKGNSFLVAEHRGGVVGYCGFSTLKTFIKLNNLAVSPVLRYAGIGRQFIDQLTRRLSESHLRRIVADVRESNLGAQKFFAACGFKAVRVRRGGYMFPGGTAEDSYVFQKWYPGRVEK